MSPKEGSEHEKNETIEESMTASRHKVSLPNFRPAKLGAKISDMEALPLTKKRVAGRQAGKQTKKEDDARINTSSGADLQECSQGIFRIP